MNVADCQAVIARREKHSAAAKFGQPGRLKIGRPVPWILLTRQSTYATLALGFDREVSDMAKASKVGGRGTTAVDAHIGQKIRARRNLLGLSQTELADAAGITFPQIQKYEKGVNRVGASRLQQFSQALGVPPSYFFEGLPTVGKKTCATGGRAIGRHNRFVPGDPRRRRACAGLLAIKEKPIRQNIIGLLETLKGK